MRIEEGGSLALANFVHPRIEPEIAFLMSAPLAGRVTMAQALAAVAAVAPAMEVIDSRYENFKFALADVIADNSSSSGFVGRVQIADEAEPLYREAARATLDALEAQTPYREALTREIGRAHV